MLDSATGRKADHGASVSRMRRASRACARCHARKVRCDAALPGNNGQCSYCVSIGVPCELGPERRRQYGRHRKPPDSSHVAPQTDDLQVDPQQMRIDQDRSVDIAPRPPDPPLSVNDDHSQAKRNLDGGQHTLGHIQNVSHGELASQSGASTADLVSFGEKSSSAHVAISAFEHQDVWSGPLDALSRASTEQHADSWGPAGRGASVQPRRPSIMTEAKPQKHFVYSSDTLHHSFLPHMTGHRRFNRYCRHVPATRPSTSIGLSSDAIPHTTRPSPRWELKTLRPAECGHTTLDHLSSIDAFYLSRLKNVLYFPETSVARGFFFAFREHVLPSYPIVDKSELTAIYDDFCNGYFTSPILMHSIFFSASQFVPQDLLTQAGFSSPSEAKGYFFERATMLYALNCEHDQLRIIQALLFISTWWSDFSEEKGTKYWITCATNLALAMGLHKAVPNATRLSQQERSLWRRIFWTVYSRDCNVSVAMGRPITINLNEIDVEELCDADFYERQDDHPLSISHRSRGDMLLDFRKHSDSHVFYAVKTARQATLLARVLAANLGKTIGSDDAIRGLSVCQNDITALRAELSGYIARQFDTDVNNTNPNRAEKRWIQFLQLSTERTLSLACRLSRAHLEHRRSWEIVAPQTLAETRAEMTRSAARTLNICEQLLELGWLRYSPNYVNTSLFVAMVTYAELIKTAYEEGRVDRIAANKYEFGIMILEEMEHLGPASTWARSLFKILADKDFSSLRKLPHASRWQSPDPTREDVPTTSSHDRVVAGEPVFELDPLQEMYTLFNFNATNNLDTIFPNDLFDTQTW